eukprot:CAMPEP_0113593090 /NCGR_PEP_ID=MMETSP0015_2-20120614/38225_1 /TAXON_ID=2838 /ORGANISM="Odontella" /LENGTH=514 /DNA_ID=CAMNT_0000499731 /DNA_START=26 /DNA_END=1570 /DNA_ORIENTATION=+ /assembly_acc=CAM_ASM_000160
MRLLFTPGSLFSLSVVALFSLGGVISFAPSKLLHSSTRWGTSTKWNSWSEGYEVRLCQVARSSISDFEGASVPATESATPESKENRSKEKILVLGGSGFLGQEIIQRLTQMGIPHIATSTSGGDGMTALDLTASGARDRVAEVASGCSAVISTVGSIGTENDEAVNAASGTAAAGAKLAGVDRFVFVGNAPRVRSLSKNLPFLKGYAKGKEISERRIRENFDDYCIVQPTFIYGGDEFALNPPRVSTSIGQIAEDILGLYPVAALSEALPGVLGVATEAPIGVERVAAAAVNAAIGLCGGKHVLEGRDEIIIAACKRRGPEEECLINDEAECDIEVDERRQGLKAKLTSLGADDEKEAFAIMEELEKLRPAPTANNEFLLGRWDFMFNVEPDMGTGIIKEILEGDTPIQLVFDLDDLHLAVSEEGGENIVRVIVSTKILQQKAELVLKTSFEADDSDPFGTMFVEKFEGIRLAGIDLPVPDSWKRSRPLEFSYVDETMMIARGNGGEPHFLVRG